MVVNFVASIAKMKLSNNFFYCHYAKLLWRAIHTKVPPPTNIENLCGTWSKSGGRKQNVLLLTAAATVCWSIWLTQEMTVFNNCHSKIFWHVLFRGAHWL
jgi:hypothetical protein